MFMTQAYKFRGRLSGFASLRSARDIKARSSWVV